MFVTSIRAIFQLNKAQNQTTKASKESTFNKIAQRFTMGSPISSYQLAIYSKSITVSWN